MTNRMLGDAETVCTAIGAFVLYVLVVGGAASLIITRAKRRTPRRSKAAGQGTPAVERRAGGWSEMSGWQIKDRNWGVVMVLLGTPAIADRTEPFVDFSSREVDWLGLLLEADRWAKRDQLLVHVAHDLVGQQGCAGGLAGATVPVTLIDLVTDLDQARTDLIRAAIDLRRGTCTYEQIRQSGASAA